MARRVNPIQDRRRRAALEQAAYLAIYERGYAGVTLSDVAGYAGVSKGTLAYHFGSRSGLLAAVMRRFTRTITVATRRALRQAATPGAKLAAYVDNQFYGVENTRRFYTVALDFLAAATRDPELMAVQRDFQRETLTLDLELARLGGEAGAEERARLMRAVVEGLSVRFLADAEPDLTAYRAECLRGLRALLGWPAEAAPAGESA
ncbi:TetR/AcrR family transcriptional regulator [Deinococcus hopiensis]|uniref:Transcriptional regulator, TetR family n=1 Tax=Deinococcus hopiensis KR-140 TaxID=695939 RepID=A0A1W1VLI8_9DEIO|nr:TetR family transcriptional regulator C-terminal domain-containing protein [Deinococcus hopiensis]SMB93911.1 transcriptional regulator, TetR family [Deinococcus hopiensis KR-140]